MLLDFYRATCLRYFPEWFQVEYDPRLINFKQLLEVFWSNHDCRQVFGQGPDVGNQYRLFFPFPWPVLFFWYLLLDVLVFLTSKTNLFLLNELCIVIRSIIFTNGTEESRLATASKEIEQLKSKNSVVVTQIQQLGIFHPAEPEHQVLSASER